MARKRVRSLNCPDRRSYRIGRKASTSRPLPSPLKFDDKRMSRRHAEIVWLEDAWFLVDLHSTNGTYVNRRLIDGRIKLQDGDLIQMGETLFAVGDATRYLKPGTGAVRRDGQLSEDDAADVIAALVDGDDEEPNFANLTGDKVLLGDGDAAEGSGGANLGPSETMADAIVPGELEPPIEAEIPPAEPAPPVVITRPKPQPVAITKADRDGPRIVVERVSKASTSPRTQIDPLVAIDKLLQEEISSSRIVGRPESPLSPAKTNGGSVAEHDGIPSPAASPVGTRPESPAGTIARNARPSEVIAKDLGSPPPAVSSSGVELPEAELIDGDSISLDDLQPVAPVADSSPSQVQAKDVHEELPAIPQAKQPEPAIQIEPPPSVTQNEPVIQKAPEPTPVENEPAISDAMDAKEDSPQVIASDESGDQIDLDLSVADPEVEPVEAQPAASHEPSAPPPEGPKLEEALTATADAPESEAKTKIKPRLQVPIPTEEENAKLGAEFAEMMEDDNPSPAPPPEAEAAPALAAAPEVEADAEAEAASLPEKFDEPADKIGAGWLVAGAVCVVMVMIGVAAIVHMIRGNATLPQAAQPLIPPIMTPPPAPVLPPTTPAASSVNGAPNGPSLIQGNNQKAEAAPAKTAPAKPVPATHPTIPGPSFNDASDMPQMPFGPGNSAAHPGSATPKATPGPATSPGSPAADASGRDVYGQALPPTTMTTISASEGAALAPAGQVASPAGSPTTAQPALSGVAYLLDASGSQIDCLPLLKKYLASMLEQAKTHDPFTIIIFQRGQAIEMPPAGLKPATVDNVVKAIDYLAQPANGIAPSGSADPSNAFRLAFGYHVREIRILSGRPTGDGPDNVTLETLMDLLDRLDSGRRVNIHAVQFFVTDPQNVLRQIAQKYHGSYTFIDDRHAKSGTFEAPDQLTPAK